MAKTLSPSAPRTGVLRRPFLIGSRVYLRPLELRDLDGPYGDWLNDHMVTQFLETGIFPSTRASLEEYFWKVAQRPDNVLLAIIHRSSDTHIGNIKLGPVHPIHRRADLGVIIGEKRWWGQGYGRESVELMLDYGFRRLNLHKITLGVHADHETAVKMYQRVGFMIEGILKEHLFRDGQFRDKYVMGILRAAYEQHQA